MGPRYVVVEGVIGVGKTTLVERLTQEMGGRPVLESFEDNPFLSDFYQDQEGFAFSTQLFFLMARYRQQEALQQPELFDQVVVSDYLFEKDRIFAELNLRGDELAIYESLFSALAPSVVTPDRVIYLRASDEVVLERIRTRGRSYEKDFDPVYLRRLAEAYDRFFFARKPPTQAQASLATAAQDKVLVLDTSDLDLRADGPEWDAVRAFVETGEVPAFAPPLAGWFR